MNINFFLPFLLLIVGCNNYQSKTKTFDEPIKQSERIKSKENQEVEYLDWHKTRINNLLPLETEEKKIQSLLSQPDSIVDPNIQGVCVSFHDREFYYAYYQNIEFEKYNDILVFRNIDFRKNKNNFLQVNSLVLNATTTLEQLKNYFPKAVKAAYPIENSKKDEQLEAIQLEVVDSFSDEKWILLFRKKKLIRIEFFLPC